MEGQQKCLTTIKINKYMHNKIVVVRFDQLG